MKLTGINSGTSWLVAVACCLLNCLNLSAYRMAGLLYVAIIERYDTNRQKASIPIVLFIMMRCTLGPLAGFIGQRIGSEETTIIGCFLTALGFGASFFAEDILAVSILLGVVYGLGLALGTTLLPSILKLHFTKNFNSANGIYSAGSCVGAFIFPPYALYLLDKYGVSGTFLIVSGIILHGVPVAMLVRLASLEFHEISTHITQDDINAEDGKYNLPPCDSLSCNCSFEFEIDKNNTKSKVSVNPDNKESALTQHNNLAEDLEKFNVRLFQNSNNVTHSGISKSLDSNIAIKQITTTLYPICKINKAEQILQQEGEVIEKSFTTECKNDCMTVDASKCCKISCDLKNHRFQTFSPDTKNDEISMNQRKVQSFKPLCSSLNIFTDATFYVIMALTSIHAYIISMFWTTIIDYSRDKGINTENEVYLLIFHPLVDLIGRLALGWVIDKGFISLTKFSMVCYATTSISLVCIALSLNFTTMMTNALLFAIPSGALMTVLPSMVFDFMEKEMHVMGISCRTLLYMPLSFTAAPLIGYFRENLGSYDGLYYLLASLSMLCFFITPLMPMFCKVRKLKMETFEERKH